jgi:hypothetical protein
MAVLTFAEMDDWNTADGATSGKCIAASKLSKRPNNKNTNKIGKSFGTELYRWSPLHTQYAYSAIVLMRGLPFLQMIDGQHTLIFYILINVVVGRTI